ncbi:MAG: hypothetical protein KatS3mg056_0480 [Chloroflexus sp.]|jgi:hypothetical protein|nr:MAG: hypothetical protein KatS3mg056_0480 [Chloroflexus sp.]
MDKKSAKSFAGKLNICLISLFLPAIINLTRVVDIHP